MKLGRSEKEIFLKKSAKVLEECGEWFRGTITDDGRTGIFPRAFVALKVKKKKKKNEFEEMYSFLICVVVFKFFCKF
jgi:hypothetical protein